MTDIQGMEINDFHSSSAVPEVYCQTVSLEETKTPKK